MKPNRTLLIALVILTHVGMQSQSKTGMNIEKTGRNVAQTHDALKKGKDLFNKVFKKKEKTAGNSIDTAYFVAFTIGRDSFFLDVLNDSRWHTMHARRDTENETASVLYLQGWKMGFANGGKSGFFELIMVPKGRNVDTGAYKFEKGKDQYDPMAFFNFRDDKTSYEMALPDKATYTHGASGNITIELFENVENGVVEGSFELLNITKSSKEKIMDENLVAKGSFRVPVTLSMPTSRPTVNE